MQNFSARGVKTVEPKGNDSSRLANVPSTSSGSDAVAAFVEENERNTPTSFNPSFNKNRVGSWRAGALLEPTLSSMCTAQGPGVAGLVSEHEEAKLWLQQVIVNL
eukprot:9437333-Pyramimonas_sp.AAC.1